MEFNKEQREVIESSGGYHLVLAPPGCGKTAVLAERIAWAHEHGVGFGQMACLTFTNRASRGMRERIYERLSDKCKDEDGLDELFIGNVHRFCSQFLFQNGIAAEHAAVIDTDTSISIIADFLEEDELRVLGDNRHRQRYSGIINLQHLMYQCEHHYPSNLMVHHDALAPRVFKELCLAFHLDYNLESAIDLYQHADHYLDEHMPISNEAQQLLQALYAAHCYEDYKQRNDLLDFEDLLLQTYDAMTAEKADWKKYDWLQVDEVQDLNPLQLAIVDLFTAPDATVVYLGDAQQAIFSFMGAKTDTLQMLRKRVGEKGFHNFYHNYRSPKYLLDVFNQYGEQQLGIERELLPTTQDFTPLRPGDLMLSDRETVIDEVNLVARMAKRLYTAYPDETTAVVVAFNTDADEISAALPDLPHFKVSGTDLFSTPEVRLLLAHLCVVGMEHNFIAWSQLLTGLHIYSSQSASRKFVHQIRELAISPVDFLCYDNSTYISEFLDAYERQDMVVFDTETTGLNVYENDVVQIAAIRIRKGEIVDELNLFLETDQEIPAKLGDVDNPLIEEYASQPHLSHEEGLTRFCEFAQGCAILAHNATYDYQIMEHNMKRYAPNLSIKKLWPSYFDSLKIIRLLQPRLSSYKLKKLLVTLDLEGQNSHLASDDIIATLSLVNYCYQKSIPLRAQQHDFCNRHRQTIQKFRAIYQELFFHAHALLYQQKSRTILSEELRYAYDYLREQDRIGTIGKFDYITRYIDIDMLTPESGTSMSEQLGCHMQELTTLKEADLCGSSSMQERVFISTVHKAKGLEFDNVIVFDAVDGKYPSAYADNDQKRKEEARKFYVAISRARRRLIITYCHHSVTRWGRWIEQTLTPFMNSIRLYF
jgi:DNA helicase-2/ATP-dependent DNA helicase PcrA